MPWLASRWISYQIKIIHSYLFLLLKYDAQSERFRRNYHTMPLKFTAHEKPPAPRQWNWWERSTTQVCFLCFTSPATQSSATSTRLLDGSATRLVQSSKFIAHRTNAYTIYKIALLVNGRCLKIKYHNFATSPILFLLVSPPPRANLVRLLSYLFAFGCEWMSICLIVSEH